MNAIRIGLCLLALASAPTARADILAIYRDRGDGTQHLHNLSTGTPVGSAMTGCCAPVAGTATIDPATREIVLVQSPAAAGDPQRITRISAVSGAVVGDAALDAGWQIAALAHDRLRATLFGFARRIDDGARHLVTVSSATGAVTAVGSALADCCTLVPGAHGLHPRRGQWHLLGQHDDEPSIQRVITIDLSTGALLAAPAIATPHALANLFFDEGSGRLLGLGRDGDSGFGTFVRVEPGSAQVQLTAASGITGCCAPSLAGLSGEIQTGAGAAHFLDAEVASRYFGTLDFRTGMPGVDIAHDPAWAIQAIVTDQLGFGGDALFADSFERIWKP